MINNKYTGFSYVDTEFADLIIKPLSSVTLTPTLQNVLCTALSFVCPVPIICGSLEAAVFFLLDRRITLVYELNHKTVITVTLWPFY